VSPIRASERARYPADWSQISLRIRERSGGRCECDGRCGHDHHEELMNNPTAEALPDDELTLFFGPDLGRCLAENRRPHPVTDSTVVLTVAHLNHTPEDCADDNLLALCNRCHLAYDADHHAETRAATRRAVLAAQMAPLFPLEMTE